MNSDRNNKMLRDSRTYSIKNGAPFSQRVHHRYYRTPSLRIIKLSILISALVGYYVLALSAHNSKAEAAHEMFVAQNEQKAEQSKEEQAGKLFSENLRTVIEQKCLGCHGASTASSGLDLRTRETMLKGGNRGPAIVPGDPAKSWLYLSIKGDHDLKMPMGKPLDEALVEQFRVWIEGGAPVPADSSENGGKEAATGNSDGKKKWNYTEADVWAFQPLKSVAVPSEGIAPEQVQTPIDAFIIKKLNEKGLRPAPPADRVSLIRRATFDLTGLPPTPEEVDAFVADKDATPKAFEKVVERLLASPRYGERWGRHWLDVVRYADTGGGANDYERPNAWRYRDYVIRSFNQDKPYDKFIIEQLAGDELDPKNPENLIATGFLRMGPWEHTGMSVEAVTRQEWLDDVTHNTGASFLALTMNCAKCHDHKFDPIPTKDYYSLQAVFASTRFDERPAPFLPVENRSDEKQDMAQLQDKIQKIKAKHEKVRNSLNAMLGIATATPAPKASEAAAPNNSGAGTTAAQPSAVQSGNAPNAKPEDQEIKLIDRSAASVETYELERAYRKRLELFGKSVLRFNPIAYSVTSEEAKDKKGPDETFILVGGSLTAPGEKVTPAAPSATLLFKKSAEDSNSNALPATPQGRRLALAKWIASPSNPLTARVMVNRIWQYHFGKGLVESSNNFGKLGKRPTHPELLDWLAQTFMEKGWSVKTMHRLIMLSAAYQRSAEHPDRETVKKLDRENTLLSHMSPKRMEAEVLRDSMLAVSGELSLEAGGPGAFTEVNLDLARQPRMIMGTVAPAWESSMTRAQRNRRSIYLFQQRSVINPLVEVFNGANLNESCERRHESTVAPQVFNLLNSQSSYDTALAFAKRLEETNKDLAQQVDAAFRLSYQRLPTEPERQKAIKHVESMTRHHTKVKPPEMEPIKPIVLSVNSELTGQTFEFTEEMNVQEYERNLHPSQVSPRVRALAELCLVLLNSNEFAYIY